MSVLFAQSQHRFNANSTMLLYLASEVSSGDTGYPTTPNTTINSTTTDPRTFVMFYSHVHPMAMNNKINMFYSVL